MMVFMIQRSSSGILINVKEAELICIPDRPSYDKTEKLPSGCLSEEYFAVNDYNMQYSTLFYSPNIFPI